MARHGGGGVARALPVPALVLGVPRVAPLLGYGAPPRGSDDPETGSGREMFGGPALGPWSYRERRCSLPVRFGAWVGLGWGRLLSPR